MQVAMHSPGDSEPLGSSLHRPVAELQLYMTSVGTHTGVGENAPVVFENALPGGHAAWSLQPPA